MSLFGKKKLTKENSLDDIQEILEDTSPQLRSTSLPGTETPLSGRKKKNFFSFLQNTPIYEEEDKSKDNKKKTRSSSTIFGIGMKKEEKSKDPLEAVRRSSNGFSVDEEETTEVHKKKRSGTLGLILDLTGVPNNTEEKSFKSPNMKSPTPNDNLKSPNMKSPKMDDFKSPKENNNK